MAKQGEIAYLQNIGEAGIAHAVHKPFSDPHCATYLMEMGALMALLPPPPARLLDVGCGTGWTSQFFARRGFEVIGADIAPDMIYHANLSRDEEELANLEFVVSDYESMPFEDEFDCAVFFDALHHAVDENLALRQVYRALKPGGVCVTSEPGVGHSTSPVSIEAMKKYGVTERDMPPFTIIAAGKKAGFREFRVYPHAAEIGRAVYTSGVRYRHLVERSGLFRRFRSLAWMLLLMLYRADRCGLVVLVK